MIIEEQNIALFKEFIDFFPEEAGEIIKKAEVLCSESPEFSSADINSRTDLIIDSIFQSGLIGEKKLEILSAVIYLRNFDYDERIFFEFLNTLNSFEALNTSDFKELKDFYQEILTNLENFETINFEISPHISEHIKFLKVSNFWENTEKIIFLKSTLEKNLERLKNLQIEFYNYYQQGLEKLKIVEQKLSVLNENNFKNSLMEQSETYIHQSDEIFTKLINLNNLLEHFSVKTPEHIIHFSAYLTETEDFFHKYYELKNVTFALEFNSLLNEQLNSRHRMILDEYRKLMIQAAEIFKKSFESIKDKNIPIRNYFLEPLKNKIESKAFNILEHFFRQYL